MTSTGAHAVTPHTPSRRRRLGSILILGAVGFSLSVAGTTALFTDQEVVTDNTFSSGTFELNVDQLDDEGVATDARLNVENFSPGQTETFDIEVVNAGTLDLRYSATGGFDVLSEEPEALNLGEALLLSITDDDGNTLYETAAAGDAASSETPLIGDSTQGEQPGDRVLAADTSETLTITVEYPAGSGNTYAGADATLDLTIDAEQVINN